MLRIASCCFYLQSKAFRKAETCLNTSCDKQNIHFTLLVPLSKIKHTEILHPWCVCLKLSLLGKLIAEITQKKILAKREREK